MKKNPTEQKRVRRKPAPAVPAAHYRIKEGLMLALLVVAGVLFAALWTYSPQDPGFGLATSSRQPVHNAVGPLGAWLASFLIDWLGYGAHVLPLLMVGKVIDLFVRRRQAFGRPDFMLAIRLLSLLTLLATGSALVHVQFASELTDLSSAGGVIGQALGMRFEQQLGVIGATLLLLGMWLFSLTLFTELSWFWVMEFAGRLVLDLLDLVNGALRELLSRRLGRRVVSLHEQPAGRRATVRSEPQVAGMRRSMVQKPVTAPASAPVPAARHTPRSSGDDPLLDELAAQLAVVTHEAAPRRKPARPEPLSPAAEAGAAVAASAPPLLQSVAEAPAARAVASRPRTAVAAPVLVPPLAAGDGSLPPLDLLDPPAPHTNSFTPEALDAMSRLLEIKLAEFGVQVEVVDRHPGPVITRFEIQPAPGIKVSRITNLAKDLARSLAVISVRVVEVIPGKTTVGIEVPNEKRQIVRLSEVLGSPDFAAATTPVPLALGHDISGNPVSADLARMPHLLVAGTTGSGKSVGVNAMLLSILFKSTPQDVRLIMIDPKMLELSIYEGIPHLLCPVVTDMKEAANSLRWSVAEMERRYRLLAGVGVRNLASFNRKVREAEAAGKPLLDPTFRRESPEDEPPVLTTLPTIVVVIDEFADMMMIVGKKVEELIARIAQKARAAGIHLILATQRPSVDVITGLIKANIPTRIAFQVSSKVDSRTILDQGGAEQLLGHGDMLYLPPGTGMPVRVHGAFVSDDEVHRLVEAWKQRGAPDYIEEILNGTDDSGGGSEGGGSFDGGEGSESDALYDEAVRFVTESRRASISAVQRKLKIGYNRAARMIEAMEMAGVVTPMNSNGSREVIAPGPVRD